MIVRWPEFIGTEQKLDGWMEINTEDSSITSREDKGGG